MAQQLSLSSRPRTLDALIGQDKMVAAIRGHITAGRDIKAWLFTGPSGCGKTTIARILALSLQCPHQKLFGTPCKSCREQKASFDIYEHNAAKVTTKEALEKGLEGADYGPRFGKYRIYILDEAHKLSDGAQNSALKFLEDSVETTIFILCSTGPQKIIETLQTRCMVYQLKALGLEDINTLVTRLLDKVGSPLPADRLADALVERGISYPRLIAQAVEKYVSGGSPEESAEVEGSTMVDTRALGRALVKGDWPAVAKFLTNAQASDIKAVRLGVLAYLRTILWQAPEVSERTAAVAKAIATICELHNTEDLVVSAGLASSLYTVCSIFSKYQH